MVIELATTKKAVQETTEQTEPKFSKEQLLASAYFANRRDLVDALLLDKEKYTISQVESLIENFWKGKVK